jgi:hypothetical protein
VFPWWSNGLTRKRKGRRGKHKKLNSSLLTCWMQMLCSRLHCWELYRCDTFLSTSQIPVHVLTYEAQQKKRKYSFSLFSLVGITPGWVFWHINILTTVKWKLAKWKFISWHINNFLSFSTRLCFSMAVLHVWFWFNECWIQACEFSDPGSFIFCELSYLPTMKSHTLLLPHHMEVDCG